MTTINLYQNHPQEAPKKFSIQSNKSIFFSLSIVIFTLLVLLGFKIINPMLANRNQVLAESVRMEKERLVGGDALERIYDFRIRLEKIRSNLSMGSNDEVSRIEMKEVLENIENDMIKNAYLVSYKYENGKVAVSFAAKNYDDVARQILNFKKSLYFSNVNVISTARKEKNIECEIDMSAKI